MESAEYDPIKVFEDVFTRDKKRLKRWMNVASRYLDLYGNKVFERHWTPVDILQEVVTRVLEGNRKYNPEKYKNFDQFIFWTIKSIVYDEVKKRRAVVPSEKYTKTGDGGEFVNLLEQKHKTDGDYIQEDCHYKTEFEKFYQQILDKDDDAALVLLCWKDEMTNQEIASELGMDVSEVEAAKKRIRYTLTGKK